MSKNSGTSVPDLSSVSAPDTTRPEGLDGQDPPGQRLSFADLSAARYLFGEQGQHLKSIEEQLQVRLHTRGGTVQVVSDNPATVQVAVSLLEQLYELSRAGYPLSSADVVHAARLLKRDRNLRLQEFFMDTLVMSARKKPIVPRSPTQKLYVDAIRRFDIVFGIGPAGTGKTYLAMAMAVGALMRKEVSRIVLTRPAVEAGEKLGFLPGDLAEKVNPYLRPLYDALNDLVDFDRAGKLMEKGVVEVAPLAFMRGRTLNDSFIILDEAQNTTSEQMKMFLTRLGIGSKAVITGDITQIDLPGDRPSGLVEARQVLSDLTRLRFVEFTKEDVVRHPLVQEVVHAYELWESRRPSSRPLLDRRATDRLDRLRVLRTQPSERTSNTVPSESTSNPSEAVGEKTP